MNLGILDKDSKIKNALTTFSYSDFSHDFSKKDTVKAVLDRLVNSRLIGSKLSSKAYATNLAILRTKLTGSVYDLFEPFYLSILPAGSKGSSLSEDKLLKDLVGFDYTSLQHVLREFDRSKSLAARILPPVIPLNISYESKIHRTYELRSYPTKIRGTYYNIPHAFSSSSSGSTKFVLIIDASFISISSMRIDEMLKAQYIEDYDPHKEYSFYILQSNENISDPATKIKSFDAGKNKNIHIHFLRDIVGKKVVYPTFENADQASNIYSNIELSTTLNADGIVDGTLKESKNTYDRKNIGMLSEINEASFLAVQQYIENNLKVSDEILSYFFLKRAGDWCQALSLLDMMRTYDVYTDTGIHTGSKTLTDLINDDYTLGIVTHDRILLGYSLLLGLNVFYSMKMVSVDSSDEGVQDGNSVIWLVHFQNNESEIRLTDYAKYITEKDGVLASIEEFKVEAREYIEKILTILKDIDYSKLIKGILELRLYTKALSLLNTSDEFTSIQAKYIAYLDELPKLEEHRKISRLLQSIQECKKIIQRYATENINIMSMTTYDEAIEDSGRIEHLLNYTSSSDFAEAKKDFTKTLDSLKSDISIIKTKGIYLTDLFKSAHFKGHRKEVGVYNYIMTNLQDIKIGGTLSLITYPVGADIDGRYVNDAQGNFYSVIDSVIVPRENADVFKNMFALKDFDSYKIFRFFIYYLDELNTELFCISGEIPYEHGNPQYMEELFVKFIHIYFQLFNFEKYYTLRDLDQIYNLYYINRYKWTNFYLLGELNHLGRMKDLNNYKGIARRIKYKLIDLYKVILKEFNRTKRLYKSVLSVSPASTRKATKRRKTSRSTYKNSGETKSKN